MDFVNANHADLSAKLLQILHEEALWCYKQHFYLFLLDSLDHLLFKLVVLLTVNGCAWYKVW